MLRDHLIRSRGRSRQTKRSVTPPALFVFVAVIIAQIGIAGPCWAWGKTGHEVIALIAEKHLTPSAREKIAPILESENSVSLADQSSWADVYRTFHPESANWHFVNIPFDSDIYDPARDCPGNDCVIAKTREYARGLTALPDDLITKGNALSFLVHFVADLHQPMHCIERGHDKGGNLVKVKYKGHPTTLHHVWDMELVNSLGGPDANAIAMMVETYITPEALKQWSAGTPEAWGTECHGVAVRMAYGKMPAGDEPELSDAYANLVRPAVITQLGRAGVRLAGILNAVFSAK